MTGDKKQKILRESLEAMGVSEDVIDDLQNLIRVLIVEKKRSKDVVLKELNELGQIVPENVNMDEFVDWLWKFFVDDRLMTYQQYVDAKNNPKIREGASKPNTTKQDILQSGRLQKRISAKSNEDNDHAHSKKDEKKRRAIYDEEEKQESDSKGKKSIFERIKKNPKLLPPPETKESDITKRIKINNNKDEKSYINVKQITKPPAPTSLISKSITQATTKRETPTTIKPKAPATKEKIQKEVQNSANIEQEENEGQQEAPPTKLKKCRNWPNCKLGDKCAFHHPTEPCKFFPKCTFGDECLYIHPAIPCKFGALCTRPDCAYLHPNIAMSNMHMGGFFPGGAGRGMKPKPKPKQNANNVSS